MSSIQRRGDKFQLRVKSPLLPKPYFDTFPTYDEAKDYGDRLEAMLAQGRVPFDLLEKSPDKVDRTQLARVIDGYLRAAPVTDSDRALLEVIRAEVVGVGVHQATYAWVQDYVRARKVRDRLAPGTIRKRVGSLARVLDWHHRATTGRDGVNPFRMLPRGYSAYTAAEAQESGAAPRDVVRDRRLLPAEEAAVRRALDAPQRRDPALTLLVDLSLDTGLRLSEAYRLRWDQVDLARGVLRVDGSKGHRGVLKPRVVPLKPVLREKLKGGGEGLVFPFWDGTPEGREKTSSKLSVRLGALFDSAGVKDFTAHDMRHEAACRWFELRDAAGRWLFSDVEICRIMGWSNLSMVLRYASIRGEDLADRLRGPEPADRG